MQPDGIPPEVISLIRFSTAEQVAEGRAGVEGQRSVNRTSAAYHGVKIRREIVVVDVSGADVKDDPNFQKLFEELPDPTLSGVLVAEQSRLVRPATFDDWPILAHFQRNNKLIYTPTGRIDPNTPEGRMALTMGGMMSGEELHTLKTRMTRGKAIKRLEGKSVGGNHMLPRTVRFVRQRNQEGKVTATHWELVPLEAERMKRAFQFLFEGDSYETIAEKVGGRWTGSGIRRCLMNPIHIGIRRYEWEVKGEKCLPKAKPGKPQPKKRRRLAKRAVPLDVPTRAELEAGAKPIVEPILSLADWDRAQEVIVRRMTQWRKAKLKTEGRARPLASGVARCSCGLPLYCRYVTNRGKHRPHLDKYYCASQHPRGQGCGMRPVRREALDATIAETMLMLADADFLLDALRVALALERTAPDPARVEREQTLAKLANGRKEGLAMVFAGELTRDEFKERMAALEHEVRALEAMVPVAAPQVNAQQIVDLVVSVFTEFAFLSFEQQRRVLRGAVKSIIVDGHAKAITTVTIFGGYLGRLANSYSHSGTPSGISQLPDLTIRFPEPFIISSAYADLRTANGHHPASLAALRRAVQ